MFSLTVLFSFDAIPPIRINIGIATRVTRNLTRYSFPQTRLDDGGMGAIVLNEWPLSAVQIDNVNVRVWA